MTKSTNVTGALNDEGVNFKRGPGVRETRGFSYKIVKAEGARP